MLTFSAILALCVAITTTLFFAIAARAETGVNQTINFQGRLLSASGAVVPDGHYNIQFKIYEGGSGTAAGNPDGTLVWTEDYVNYGASAGVQVRNGYLSVDLGSRVPFGDSINWNEGTLWISMNVAGTSDSCTTFGQSPCLDDGEMLPMKRLSTSPYAMNAARLGGIDADGFIKNTTDSQEADFNISGTGTANTLQGNTSVISPLFDSTATGTLSIGTVSASTISIGSAATDQTISIGTGAANKTLTLGSMTGSSHTKIQGGTEGVKIDTVGAFAVRTALIDLETFKIDANGNIDFTLSDARSFNIKNRAGQSGFLVGEDGNIYTGIGTNFIARGPAVFTQGITIQGTGSSYVTPVGYQMSTAINIPSYTVGDYSSILAFGLPSTSASTARGLAVTDARTGPHQATIGVFSVDEQAIMGFTWNGSNTTGYVSNTANTLALQGNGLDLLTATNNNGQANVGIGNAATSGYALDVTGDTNTSSQYRIGGNTALTSSSLTFSGNSASSIASASGQSLNISSDSTISIQTGANTSATFNNTNLKVGDNTGSATLLTLDNASTAPTGILGSMYYDTTVGKVQCYEASGWGDCGSRPDTFVSLSPEYSGAVMNGTGIGTMKSDICSDTLDLNDGSSGQPTICGTNETYNFYNWMSTQTSTQTRSIYVTYQLPASFKEFVAGSTSLLGRTDSTDASVSYQTYRKSSAGLVACGSTIAASTGAQTAWQSAAAVSANDPANCGFAAGDSIVVRINLASANSANAYVSNLGFTFSNQ